MFLVSALEETKHKKVILKPTIENESVRWLTLHIKSKNLDLN